MLLESRKQEDNFQVVGANIMNRSVQYIFCDGYFGGIHFIYF